MDPRRAWFLVLLLPACLGVGAFEPPLAPQDARAVATGGRHAALADDINTMFNNPAGLQGLNREIQFSEITLGLTGPIFDIASVVIADRSGQQKVADFLLTQEGQDLISGLYSGLNLTGPLSFAYVGGGLGFSAISYLELSVGTASPTDLRVMVSENYVVAGGYSFRLPLGDSFPGTIDVGGMLKTTIRGEVETKKSVLAALDLFSNPFSLLSGEPFALSLGVGVDLGVLYRLGNYLSVGIVGRDAFTPTRKAEYAGLDGFLGNEDPSSSAGLVAPDLSVGVMYSPRIQRIERYVDRWKFFLDYRDSLELLIEPAAARNPLLNIGVGVEAVVLEILSLRGGFTDGLPAAGMGLDLTFLDLDLAVYGSEVSTEPGLRSAYNLMVGFRFSGRSGSFEE